MTPPLTGQALVNEIKKLYAAYSDAMSMQLSHDECGELLRLAKLGLAAERMAALVDELTEAVDLTVEDIGGHRGSLEILRDLGPALTAYRDAGGKLAAEAPPKPAEQAQIDETELGRVTWQSSAEDSGPDVGISVGLGNGENLWIGEISDQAYAEHNCQILGPNSGWWLVHYKPKEMSVIGRIMPSSVNGDIAAREFFEHRLAPLLSRPLPELTDEDVRQLLKWEADGQSYLRIRADDLAKSFNRIARALRAEGRI